MEGGHVRLAFDLAEYERIKEAKPEFEKAAKSRKTVARKQRESSGKPAVKKTKTGRLAKTRKTRQTAKVVESDDSDKEPSSGSDDEEPVESNQITLGGKDLLHHFRKSRSLDVDDPKPGGHDAAPEWVHRHLVTGWRILTFAMIPAGSSMILRTEKKLRRSCLKLETGGSLR